MALNVSKLVSDGINLAYDLMPLGSASSPNVRRVGTYQRVTGGSYDTETGTVTPADVSKPFQFLLGSYSQNEVGRGGIEAGDEMVVVKMELLKASGVRVEKLGEHDVIASPGEPDRYLVNWTVDPTAQVAILQVRSRAQVGTSGSASASASGSGGASS